MKKNRVGRWNADFDEYGKTIKIVYEASFRRLLGYADTVECEASDDSWLDSIHPDDSATVEKAYADAVAKHTEEFDYDVEYRMKTASGEYRWFHDYARCLRREDGSVKRFEGVIFDIQESIDRQEKQLLSAKEHERLRADSLAFILKNDDLEAFVEFFSARALQLYGCDQVIYRDIEGRMILKDKPGSPTLDLSLCKNCPHFAFDAPVYNDGFTAMDDCREGWNGVPVHKECPVGAALTYLVHEDEKVFGYIALHYLGRTHTFTNEEKVTFDRVAKFLSMVLLRRKQRFALKESQTFSNYFVDTFAATYLINLKTHDYKVYSRTEALDREYPKDLNPDYFIGMKAYAARHVHPDDRGPLIDFISPLNLTKALESQKTAIFNFRVVRNGENRNYYVRAVRGTEADTVALAFADITGQTKIRTDASVSEAKAMLSLLEDLDSVFIIDPDSGEYTFFMPGADSIEHYTTMRKEGHNFYDDIPMLAKTVIHEDDREQFLAFYARENLLKIAETREPQETVNRWFVKEGLRTIRNKAVVRVDTSGKATIVLGVWDLTDEIERLKMEQSGHMLQAFGDMMNASTWQMELGENSEVISVVWSDELRHMFGFENEQEFPNELAAWTDRLHPEDSERIAENFSRGVHEMDSGVVYDAEYRFRCKDGEYRWYHAYGRIDKNSEGGRVYYGIVVNISAEKELAKSHRQLEEQQQRIEEALAMAQAASKAKTSFLFNMSHDIRTPMNAIMGFSDIALKRMDAIERGQTGILVVPETPDAPEIDRGCAHCVAMPELKGVRDCLAKIRSAGSLLLSIINSILDMSRIESGNAKLEETEGDVLRSFESVETTMRSLAVAKSIKLTFDYGEIADRFVYADQERCTRVLVNLISNAIKYTKTGGWVRVVCDQIERGRYRYTVSDNGIGMSEEFQEHLFEEFTRERNSTTSGIQGTGLGLALCKSFVELMGGTIECQSKQGEGTTFTVELPFRVREVAADPAIARGMRERDGNDRSENGEAGRPLFAGRRVLLVEDNELNREVATYILKEQGFEVDAADDGSIAVKLVKNNGCEYYDYILMDIQMPIMGGYEATRAIRAFGFKRPIIALSANAFAEDNAASIVAGMDDHVAKPIKVKELMDVMKKFAHR